jgi:hypothetical protein
VRPEETSLARTAEGHSINQAQGKLGRAARIDDALTAALSPLAELSTVNIRRLIVTAIRAKPMVLQFAPERGRRDQLGRGGLRVSPPNNSQDSSCSHSPPEL